MLPPLDHPLTLASTASDDAPFTLRGSRCTITGSERGGIHMVRMDSQCALLDCYVDNAECTEFRISPLGVTRRLRVDGVGIVERTVVAPAAGACAIEWIAEGAIELALVNRDVASDVALSFSAATDPAHMRLDPAHPLLLIVAKVNEPGSPDAAAWVRLHQAAAARRAATWLRLEQADADITTAFAWAQYRVAAGTNSMSALALVACGEFKNARAEIAAAPEHDFLFLLSHYFAASGDTTFVHAHWPRVTCWPECVDRLDASTLRGLGHTAEAVGAHRVAADLAHAARDRPEAPVPWRAFDMGQTRAAVAGWRELALSCFQKEKGAWPAQPGASAADVVTGFVYGLLGFRPEAARSRLALRPQIPEEWPAASIRNIRIGDALVDLAFEQTPDGWAFTLSQTAGAYPIRLVCEPALPVLPASVVIDGHEADLDFVPFGERIVAPIQIVLDERRHLELHSRTTKNPPPQRTDFLRGT